ncbi:hypothetical protein NU10_01000 [Flavobacterium dauae]|nr:hypothetical protein [Flavobacterium dauae]WLD23999.1 hypothetical protein NU10_01000 [Flavobacterium dauae]
MNNFKKAGRVFAKPLPDSIKIKIFKTIETIEKGNKSISKNDKRNNY